MRGPYGRNQDDSVSVEQDRLPIIATKLTFLSLILAMCHLTRLSLYLNSELFKMQTASSQLSPGNHSPYLKQRLVTLYEYIISSSTDSKTPSRYSPPPDLPLHNPALKTSRLFLPPCTHHGIHHSSLHYSKVFHLKQLTSFQPVQSV